MKKLIVITVVSLTLLTVVFSQPVIPPVLPVVARTVVKIDNQTVEITTTTTTETIVRHDRAELQTELDHIPDRIAELQQRISEINKRRVELMEILKVFE